MLRGMCSLLCRACIHVLSYIWTTHIVVVAPPRMLYANSHTHHGGCAAGLRVLELIGLTACFIRGLVLGACKPLSYVAWAWSSSDLWEVFGRALTALHCTGLSMASMWARFTSKNMGMRHTHISAPRGRLRPRRGGAHSVCICVTGWAVTRRCPRDTMQHCGRQGVALHGR